MKKLILSIVAAALTVLGLGSVASISPAYAAPQCFDKNGNLTNDLAQCAGGEGQADNLMGTLTTVINVILAVVGFIAVIMIIIGGISFITSQGDSSKVTKARNTILYGVVGLVVALLAFAIVNFVLKGVFGGASTS